jgi:hypothetical protein
MHTYIHNIYIHTYIHTYMYIIYISCIGRQGVVDGCGERGDTGDTKPEENVAGICDRRPQGDARYSLYLLY